MAKKPFIPPHIKEKAATMMRKAFPDRNAQPPTKPVSRPNIQVPTLPKQSQTTLQSEVSAAQGRTVRGVENVSANPQPAAQVQPNKELQAKVAAYQPTGKEPLQNAEQPTRSNAPPPSKSAYSGMARGKQLTQDSKSIQPPPPSSARNAAIGTAAQQTNITAEKAAGDRSAQTGQNRSKEQEKTPDKNNDKGRDNDR